MASPVFEKPLFFLPFITIRGNEPNRLVTLSINISDPNDNRGDFPHTAIISHTMQSQAIGQDEAGGARKMPRAKRRKSGHLLVSEEERIRPEETATAYADRLSSSLASITSIPAPAAHMAFSRALAATENVSDGGEASAESSTGSSNNLGSSDARQVTASTTTNNTTSSGSEERDFSRAQNSSASSSEEREVSRKDLKPPPQSLINASHHMHHLHHHSHGHFLHHHPKPKYNKGADDFGLPVPLDDRLPSQSTTGLRHAAVVAHLPPPSADSFSSSGSGGEGERNMEQRKGSLLEPYREPGYHTIRRTFNRLSQRENETDSSGDKEHAKHKKAGVKRPHAGPIAAESPKKKKKRLEQGSDSSSDDNAGTNGSSSGSGTETGYFGSASSNDNAARNSGDYSSPSVSSSEESRVMRKRLKSVGDTVKAPPDANRPLISKKVESNSLSSEIADFSSGASETEVVQTMKALREESSSITSSSNDDSDEQDLTNMDTGKIRDPESPPRSLQVPTGERLLSKDSKPRARPKIADYSTTDLSLTGKPPLLAVGPDIIAHVLTFLEPPQILDVLTAPLSKDWIDTFCRHQELWRVLCIVEPFKAQVKEVGDNESDESLDSFPMNVEAELRLRFGKFRMMYTSFVRCMRYLARIKDDAMNGRSPSVIDYGATDATSPSLTIGGNQNLQAFLARARGFVIRNRTDMEQAADSLTDSSSSDEDNNNDNQGNGVARMQRAEPIGVADDGSSSSRDARRKRKRRAKEAAAHREVRYASSSITRRLLLPASSGEAVHTDLPWSCAIYSIVNWMVAFSNVEGIQTMCLKVLPFILEDEQQRMTAQRAGLTDVVLRGMVMFPDSVPLHTAAFHTIVLLARPLGGREGMLFHSSMVNASGIFSGNAGGTNGKSGIAVMLDSMRRFESEEVLQAMSCWSLVNIALAPAQKEVLVKLGGIQATAGAMIAHPRNAEVQFRALFALINLVIPSVAMSNNVGGQSDGSGADEEGEGAINILDDLVEEIVGLVVRAMKNYCSSEAILNRACLVLHNLSLTPAYHSNLLLVPHCYQMLEWCLANYRTDQVLQQSATGTLHRLQATLSTNEALRTRFHAALQAQHRVSLQQAHNEALALRQLETTLAREASS